MKQLILSCAFSLLLLTGYAQTWVSFNQGNPQEPIIQITQSNNQAVQFNVVFPGMYSQDIEHDGTTYQRLQIPGATVSNEAGEPELPYLVKYVAIPECSNVQLTTLNSGTTLLSNYTVYPAPDQQEFTNPDGYIYIEEIFAKSDAMYSKDEYVYGVDAEIASYGYMRGQKYARIHIYPVQFNPTTN